MGWDVGSWEVGRGLYGVLGVARAYAVVCGMLGDVGSALRWFHLVREIMEEWLGV